CVCLHVCGLSRDGSHCVSVCVCLRVCGLSHDGSHCVSCDVFLCLCVSACVWPQSRWEVEEVREGRTVKPLCVLDRSGVCVCVCVCVCTCVCVLDRSGMCVCVCV